jgi:RNA polymerase sigma factor (sigma-70 family)
MPSDEKTTARPKMKKPDEDAALVEAAQGGNTAAFDDLVRKHHGRLYGLVYHMTSNREDANDLLQDIFAKAYRSLKRFRGKSSFYTWIYSISVNMTLNFLKKRNRRRGISLDDVDSGIGHDKHFIEMTSKSNPVKEANINELQIRLNEAMMELSEDHRAVVTMFDIQGLPHNEISKILGVSAGTVRSRLFYAHRQLQNHLEEFRGKLVD